MAEKQTPPPLPSRQRPAASSSTHNPERAFESNVFSSQHSGRLSPLPLSATAAAGRDAIQCSDPSSASTQSLLLQTDEKGSKRNLLIVYIHGFYGNDRSFHSFPAHLHSILASILADTHVIHSKIYPRYKTYRAIEAARDNFSTWLEPHESPMTDVILVGHSMGGLLAAETVLMKSDDPATQVPFKHRILGTISLDSPFLGLNPGIILSGIASLFFSVPSMQSPLPEISPRLTSIPSSISLDTTSGTSRPVLSVSPQHSIRCLDPNYDPPFFNDQPFREQPFAKRMKNFISKHRKEGVFNAMGNHVMSHLEFGGCLADYPSMSARYKKLRALEDVDEVEAKTAGHPVGLTARVRFVNYYTLCNGRPRPPKHWSGEDEVSVAPVRPVEQPDATKATLTEASFANIDIGANEAKLENEIVATDKEAKLPSQETFQCQPTLEDNINIPHLDGTRIRPEGPEPAVLTTMHGLPTPPDRSPITDKNTKRWAKEEAKRQHRSYQRAQKLRDKITCERKKPLVKLQKLFVKTLKKTEKGATKELEQDGRPAQKQAGARVKAAKMDQQHKTMQKSTGGEKPPKLRKFCVLPSKIGGVRDSTWVSIYMMDVDEIGAHCGLFFPGRHYEPLLAHIRDLVVRWVHDDIAAKTALSIIH